MKLGFWVAAFLVATANIAWGAGYERTVLWSGKQNGIAGSGAATVHDSEAIYFNPAGLADVNKFEFSGNFSPTWVTARGPVNTTTQLTSETAFLPVFGFTAGYKLCEKLGIGAGIYAAGGSRASYPNIDFSTVPGFGANTLKPNATSEVTMLEYSLGVGYTLLPGLKVGASWRVLHVGGTVETPIPSSTTLVAAHLRNLNATKYNGFRLGAQYDNVGGWGLGLVVRTGVSFDATADLTAEVQPRNSAATPTSLAASTATLSNSFPLEATLGGYYDFMDKALRVVAEYAYANYSQNAQLSIAGTLGGQPITPIAQNWKDLHTGKIGAEYRGFNKTVIRAGYAIASDVTPKAQARATFSSPGLGHTITVGAGHSYFDDQFDFDLALEHSFSGGTVAAADLPAGSTTQVGEYEGKVWGLHLGATYRF